MSEIKGYRKLSAEEIDAINLVKANEKAIMQMIKIMEEINIFEIDKRMLAIGKTNIEQSFMWLVKSIAKPE